jgi:hypothetical protein
MNNMEFREITIPGDVLDDDNLPDGAKILYGKIARLSYKNGYCWASNNTLAGTKSGKTASRHIKLLEKFGYIKCFYENNMQVRKIYICHVDSKIHGETPPGNGEPPLENRETPLENRERPLPKIGNKQYKKNNEMNNQREQPKRIRGTFSLDENLNPNLTDFSKRLETLTKEYNRLRIGPPFRKMAINLTPSESSDLMNIMQVYPDEISLKAMENYATITNSTEYDPGVCVYRGFISFMVRGIEKYSDEAEPFKLFRKKTRKISFSSLEEPKKSLKGLDSW